MDNEKFNEILPRLEVIAFDTKLRINKVEDFKLIKAINKRIIQEEKRQRIGVTIMELQNVTSLYLTVKQLNTLNSTS